jgi:Zn-dependent protease with chaperone function
MSPSVISNGFALTDPPLAFSGQITRTRLSPRYRLGLVVAVTMLLLPVLYLGLIAAAGMGVWWHATAYTWILEGDSAKQIRLIAYATPLVAGVVLVFFMAKPILARAARRQRPLLITEADEPALFAFIDEICRQVGARRPRRVQVDCNVNASASLMDSRLGLQRDLVVTIGLPLVAGLSARQLAGVLAHEFGHFAQGGGMRLTTIVRTVNAWFGRVVYERDAWDEKFERWSTEADWRAAIVLVVARLGVWFSRWVRRLEGRLVASHAAGESPGADGRANPSDATRSARGTSRSRRSHRLVRHASERRRPNPRGGSRPCRRRVGRRQRSGGAAVPRFRGAQRQ